MLYLLAGFSQQNGPKSIDWLTRAANQDMRVAQDQLGQSYEFGTGTTIDKKKAFDWYLQAAQNGYLPAQYRIALFYANGDVVAKDESQAFTILSGLNQKDSGEISYSL